MSRTTKAISDELLAKCKKELKKQGIQGENGRRLQAIISARWHGITLVAKIYNISRETLMRWIRKFQASGPQSFTVAPGRGRRFKLNNMQKEQLHEYIINHGKNITLKHVQKEVATRFGIGISNSTAHRLLKDLGFSYITPRPAHYKQNKTAWENFKKNLEKEMIANPNFEVFFFDEARFGTHSKIGHGWFKTGERTSVFKKLGFKNFYLYSAVNPKTGLDVSLVMPNVNTENMNAFLEEMGNKLSDKKILLIMDQAGWHKAKLLQIPSNIKIFYLPPYSPELNPIERLWRYIKDNVLKNRIYETLKQLEDNLCDFVCTISAAKLCNICNVSYYL